MNTSDTVRLPCPKCGNQLRVKPSLIRGQVKCPSCLALFPMAMHPAGNQTQPDQPQQSAAAPSKRWPLVGVVAGGALFLGLGLWLFIYCLAGGKENTHGVESIDVAALDNHSPKTVQIGVKSGDVPDRDANSPGQPMPDALPKVEAPPVTQQPEQAKTALTDYLPDKTTAKLDIKVPEPKPAPAAPPVLPSDPPVAKGAPSKDAFILPFEAVGSPTRLEKLKVVQLAGSVSFTTALNVNVINLTWCWEPAITIRFQEFLQSEYVKVKDVFDRAEVDKKVQGLLNDVIKKTMATEKRKLKLSPDISRKLDYEIGVMLKKRSYKSFFETNVLLKGKEVYQGFNQLLVPLVSDQGTSLRNLCFALSISNLVPVKRLAFKIEPGPDAMVKETMCRQFMVEDAQGTKLEFAFDKRTDQLTKISHRGLDPRLPGLVKDAQWDHYFSAYSVTDGINQWRQLEVHVDNLRYALLTVGTVKYFDDIPAEMRTAVDMVGAKQQDDDLAAEKLLKGAQQVLKTGNVALARVRLNLVIDEYSSSRWAVEARKLLATLPK